MDMTTTLKGSYFETLFPPGWDIERIRNCCSNSPESILEPQPFWNKGFNPISCKTVSDFEVLLGHEIAMQIRIAKEEGRELILILPVGPMGMYRWTVFFLKEWNIDCAHVHGFNMDEWSDAQGNTLPSSDPAAFQNAMLKAFYGPLGLLTVPESQRHFATAEELPQYAQKIAELKQRGARQILIFGIGRACHIAFWEPHFALEYATQEEWMAATYRIGARLHPLTIEQNALTSFRSNYALIPCYANTVGPGIIFQSDYIIGGADGIFSRGMQWQGMSLWMTLRYGPETCVTSSFIPTLPGKLFFVQELAGPLCADTN